jgi:hypothetical protein
VARGLFRTEGTTSIERPATGPLSQPSGLGVPPLRRH